MGASNYVTSLPVFLWKTFYLIFIFPASVIIALLHFLAQLIAWTPFIIFMLVLWGAGTLTSRYGNVGIEELDYAFRCIINPIVDNFIGPLLNLLRTIYNPTICFWDSVNYFFYGYFNAVLVPDAVACGASAVLVDIGCVATQFFDSLVVYLATGKFLTGFYDMSKLSAALTTLVNDWIVMMCCLCEDLCCLVKVVPFILPLPPPLNVIIPALMTQYEFWQSIESLINLGAAITQILWPLLINLLNLTAPSSRPNYLVAASYACQFIERINPALEGALQRNWDTFIPWRFNFSDVLGGASSLGCIGIDSVQVILTVATNVDIVVFNLFTPAPNTYIGPPYTMPVDLWRGPIMQSIIIILNTWAPVSNPEFYFDVHTIGRQTVIEGACVTLTRIICDFDGTDTPCFNMNPDFANMTMNGGFLQDFNWCCFVNTAITAINDWNVILYSFWLHTTSAEDWFSWLDLTLGPNLYLVANDLTAVADCLFSLVDAVPVVGYCLKQVFVQLLRFAFLLGAFSLQVITALVTLIFDFLGGKQTQNFLFDGDTAITRWEEIVNVLNGDTPASLINCIAYILNYGIQIPPITLNNNGQVITCGPPQCTPIDYIPPPPIIGRTNKEASRFPIGGHLIDTHPRYRQGSERRSRVTPILVYNESKVRDTSRPWFAPLFEARSATARTPSGLLVDPAKVIEQRRITFYEQYQTIEQCQANDLYKQKLRRDDPWKFKLLKARNQLPDTSHCMDAGAYDNVYPGKERREQRRILFASVESFGILGTWVPPNWWGYATATLNDSDPLEWVRHVQGVTRSREVGDPDYDDPPSHVEIPPWSVTGFQDEEELETDYGTSLKPHHAEAFSQAAATAGDQSPKIIPPPPPLTTRPTTAPIAGCPAPGQPPNPCFDLACFPRQILQTASAALLLIGHILDGLLRGNFPAPGETQWGYFTGQNCAKRCLEDDVINLITYALNGLVCACKLLNLILPSSPMFPQPDFCCALTTAADFITNSIQVLINAIRSLCLDSPQFIYFNQGYFVRDIDELFRELLQIVVCLCQFVRYIFPISQLTGGSINGGGAFDICCVPMILADTGIEVAELVIVGIISLATIYGAGASFWQTSTEQPLLVNIGFLVQVQVVLDTFFGQPGGICAAQGRPQGIGGITSCICQVLALIFPIRQNPAQPIGPLNCPTVDLCCPIRDGGYLAADVIKFLITALSGLWQSWNAGDNGHCDPGWLQPGQSCDSLPSEPYAFLDFVFCNELTAWELANLPLTPVEQQQQAKCGKALPIIAQFTDIISACPCEFLALADAFLAMYFHGFDCFCGPIDGFFTNLGDLVNAIITSLVTLIRRSNDLTYWQPFGTPSPNGGPNQFNEHDTWTWEFFGPIADSLCNTLVASTCFLDILLPFCTVSRNRVVQASVAWLTELVVRIGAIIEGIVGIFTTGSHCSDPGQTCPPGSPHYGVSVSQLADVFVSLGSFPLDALIADSGVVCSVLNPPTCPASDLCCCYNTNPQSGVLFIHVTEGPVFSNPLYQCAQCLNDECTEYQDSYAFRTCNMAGAMQVPCFNDTTGGASGLPSCSMDNPLLTKVDGIVMAALKYLQCVFVQLVPAFGQIFQGLVVMVSVVWQLVNPILRLISAVIMFVFSLFSAVGGGFALLTLLGDFVNIFTALSSVFTTGPVIPQQVNFRSETRAQFRARATAFFDNETATMNRTFADGIAALISMVWDYDTKSCMNNFTDCACRNLVIDEALCERVRDHHRRGLPVDSGPILAAVASTMNGSTFCDHHMRFYDGTAPWEEIWPSDRSYYIECMEKVIQGGRLNDANPVFPADFFYRHESPLDFWDNARKAAVVGVRQEHEWVTRRRQSQRVLPDDVFAQRWARRNEYMQRWVRNHPRWKKSLLTAGLLKIDQFEHKFRTGFYMPMIRRALRNIEEGNIPRVSLQERFGILASHLPVVAGNLIQIQIRQAAKDVYDGLAAIPEALEMLRTHSIWSIYWDAVQRSHAHPPTTKKRAAHEEKRAVIMKAMRSSPIYQWWYSNWTQSWAPRSGPLRENPFTRLADHLHRVFTYQRLHWKDSPSTIANMDLQMRDRFGRWFEHRFRLNWTPEILANWASAARIWYRTKDRLWPGSVDQRTKERFSIGPNCTIDWNKRTVDNRALIEDGSLLAQARRHQGKVTSLANGIGVNCSNASQYMRDLMDTRTKERGFLIGGNCLLFDGFLDELVFLTTYCADTYQAQLPPFMRESLQAPDGPLLWKAITSMGDVANRKPFDNPNTTEYVYSRPHETEDQWQSWATWLKRRSLDWVRPKFRPFKQQKKDVKPTVHDLYRDLSHQQWLRAGLTGYQWARAASGATSFDLFAWFISVIDDWFGTNVGQAITNFFQMIQDWFQNSNLYYFPGPVGWDYWSRFFFRCQVEPDAGESYENAFINLSCKVGIGLESAIAWVTGIMVAAYIFCAIFIPFLAGFFTLLPVVLVWLILVPAVAWHYSPRCWLMTPALILPGEGAVGISVPYWPFPIALPALPFCLMDEITALIIKYTSMCWCKVWWGTPLEFICPPYAVNGNPCPPCPERIVVTNCNSVGLGGGIDTFIYLCIWLVPQSSRWIKGFAQIVFLTGHFGETLARVGDYIYASAARFTDIPASQSQLFGWCFGLTLPSIAGVILFFVFFWLIFGLLWTLALVLVGAIADWVQASPFPYMFGSAFADSSAYDALLGANPATIEEQAYVELQPQDPTSMTGAEPVGQRILVPVPRRRTLRSYVFFAPIDEMYARGIARAKKWWL